MKVYKTFADEFIPMLKNKRSKIALVAIMICSLIMAYGAVPSAQAASFESAKATLSDSDLGVIATTTVTIDMGDDNYLETGEYIRIEFDPTGNAFTMASPVVTCPTNTNASTTATAVDEIVDCVATGFVDATSTQSIEVGNITNPNSNNSLGYLIRITTYTSGDVEIETSDVRVYIIDDVLVTATVDASLTFGVTSLANGVDVNGTSTTINASGDDTALPFGQLTIGVPSIAGQRLSVQTNAASGYSVTVHQDAELRNGAGATINSFNNAPDGQGSTTPGVWAAPEGTLDVTRTYGHMGLISSDSDIFAANDTWAGLNGVAAYEVLSHTGPSGGYGGGSGTEGSEWAEVAYAIQISALQEAGDYQNALTYVCTPTY